MSLTKAPTRATERQGNLPLIACAGSNETALDVVAEQKEQP